MAYRLARRCTFLLLIGIAMPALAQSVALSEQKIKAGMVYNFLKYTEWPSEALAASAPVTVCMLGGDPFAGSLAPMEGRSVNQHNITLRNVSGVNDISGCQLIIIHASQQDRWSSVHAALAGKPVLTVSDMDDFAKTGGVIAFSRQDNRIVVTLNIAAVHQAHLAVGSRLLSLVNVVGGQ